MVKKSGKPDIDNKGSKKKPETGRAFLFDSQKSKADEFLSDEGFVLGEDIEAKNSNNFFADDAGLTDNKETLAKNLNTQEIKDGKTTKAKDEKAEYVANMDAASAKDILEETTDKIVKTKKERIRRKDRKLQAKEDIQKSEDSEAKISSNIADTFKEDKEKEKPEKRSRRSGREEKTTGDIFDDELFDVETEQQMEDPNPFFLADKAEIEKEDPGNPSKKKRGFFGIARKTKSDEQPKEETIKNLEYPKPEIAKKEKTEKSARINKKALPLSAADELELIKKKQKKAVKRLNRRNGNPLGTAVSWLKSLLPEKGKDKKALKFAQTGMRKNSNRKKRILIYSGAGILAAAIVLAAIFIPFGRNGEIQADGLEDEDTIAIADVLETTKPTITPTPIQTTQETDSVLATPIVTTEPDPTHQTIDIDDMVDDCMVEAKLYYNEVGYSNNYYEYTDNEIYILAQLIYGESRGESLDGMVAVGNVVMNRVLNRRYFGNTITAVVTASGQFSGYKSTIVPSSKCKIAARKVLDFQVWVVPQNVYYFKSSGEAGIDWASHKFYTRIGGHNFYTHNYGGRSTSGKIPPRLYERTYKWPRFGCVPENRVYRIQYMLNKLGYNVTADNFFGAGTMKELKKFQEKKGLEADGVAGPSTIEALIRAFGVEEYYEKFYT